MAGVKGIDAKEVEIGKKCRRSIEKTCQGPEKES